MTQVYFIPVFEHESGVSGLRNGDVEVKFLIEGKHGDGDQLIDTAFGNGGRVVVQSVAGTAIIGKVIELANIVGWAIENGYLESDEARRLGLGA